MDSRQFLAEFEHIASTPIGIQKIRSLILHLAISGNLTSRIASDTFAAVLIAQNRDEKERLIESGAIARQVAYSRIADNAKPWRVPTGWLWCRLGEVTNYGQPIKAELEDCSEDTWVLELGDIESDSSRLLQRVRVSDRPFKSAKNRFKAGDVLYGKLRPALDKVLIADEDGVCTTEMMPISFFMNIDAGYLRWYLKSPFFVTYATNSTHGMSMPRLGTRQARNALFPFPPAEEQKRIVAKVDELMTLCDKLEAQQKERDVLRKFTGRTLIDGFVNAQTADDFEHGWKRIEDCLGLWLNNEDAITQMSSAIDFLACRGMLTKSITIPKDKPEQDPFPIPGGWSWVTVDELSEYVTSGSRGWKRFMSPQGDAFIRSQDIKHNALIFEDPVFVNLPGVVEGTRTLVRPGDLLMTITGANVGKCAQMPSIQQKAYVSQHVALIRIKDVRQTPFIHWWITNAYGGQKHLAQFIYGDKPGLNLSQVRSIPIPLPPQTIQDQIIETLEHFSSIVNRLAEQIKDVEATASLFVNAAVASITGIRSEEKAEMKVPKTELISTLRIRAGTQSRETGTLTEILANNDGELPAKTLWNLSGLEINVFYQVLKTEMRKGWIIQPEVAYVKEKEAG